ncbi:Glycine-rich RNA-binding protein RZ1B [Mycena venus]|uniref:Glycine-rich RNA-binding protein RZ1B n=1 Tax=Mycena venus TaxID=2733690 RepID=A0A8H7CJG7_9AGAR|nr:Glycine-rich RNA-binding protein RZ1B [Mycena venus]
MAASPSAADEGQDNWGPSDDAAMGSRRSAEPSNEPLPVDDRGQDPNDPVDYPRGSSVGTVSVNKGDHYREKQVKPNKVYIGGLPEHTRPEDLQSCFGQIGNITNIELKIGYGFVEFDSRQAAEESVAKYHEGHFMGNKIRVELSHGGGRTAKYTGDPGACFKCGNMGHWASTGNAQMPPRAPSAACTMGQCTVNVNTSQCLRVMYSHRVTLDTTILLLGTIGGLLHPRVIIATTLLCLLSTEAEITMITDAVLPFLSVIAILPQYRLRTTEAGAAILPRRTLLIVAMADPPAPPAPQYDRYDRRPHERYPPYPPAGGRARTPPRVRDDYDRVPPPRDYDYRGRPPSPPSSRYANDFPRGGPPDVAAQRYRYCRSSSPAFEFQFTSALGAVPKVPLPGLQALRMSKITMAVAETFLATAILVLQGLGIMLPLLCAMDEMDLLMLVATDGLECGLLYAKETKSATLQRTIVCPKILLLSIHWYHR